ncbi:hypothetical protein [Neisseria meningitidis]|nr:hypothetical protein [Neisseria meningitidis]
MSEARNTGIKNSNGKYIVLGLRKQKY